MPVAFQLDNYITEIIIAPKNRLKVDCNLPLPTVQGNGGADEVPVPGALKQSLYMDHQARDRV